MIVLTYEIHLYPPSYGIYRDEQPPIYYSDKKQSFLELLKEAEIDLQEKIIFKTNKATPPSAIEEAKALNIQIEGNNR